MKAALAVIVLAGCTRPMQPAMTPAPAGSYSAASVDAALAAVPKTEPAFDYCGVVFASIDQAVAPYRKDMETLETPCVRRNVTANGLWYAEAIGFDPMPTLTCTSRSWVVQIGEYPPRAPTDVIVLVGFSGRDERRFFARVERSEWRNQPNRFRTTAAARCRVSCAGKATTGLPVWTRIEPNSGRMVRVPLAPFRCGGREPTVGRLREATPQLEIVRFPAHLRTPPWIPLPLSHLHAYRRRFRCLRA